MFDHEGMKTFLEIHAHTKHNEVQFHITRGSGSLGKLPKRGQNINFLYPLIKTIKTGNFIQRTKQI